MFPTPSTPPWHWFGPSFSSKMDWLSLVSWQKRREKKGSERKREGGSWLRLPWDQLCLFCGCSTTWSSARLSCWSCTCGSEKDWLLFLSWPHIPLHFPSYSPALWILSSSVQLASQGKKKKILSLSPTSPGRSTGSFRRRQAREIAQGRVLGSQVFGWERGLRQAQQLFRNFWLQPYNNVINTCLVSASSHLCAAQVLLHTLPLNKQEKPFSLLFVKSWTGSSRSQLNPCTSKEMGGIVKKGERERVEPL